jgi:hypothetical protein
MRPDGVSANSSQAWGTPCSGSWPLTVRFRGVRSTDGEAFPRCLKEDHCFILIET